MGGIGMKLMGAAKGTGLEISRVGGYLVRSETVIRDACRDWLFRSRVSDGP
jgi:hypothetical protein